jgi:hypothetical protein
MNRALAHLASETRRYTVAYWSTLSIKARISLVLCVLFAVFWVRSYGRGTATTTQDELDTFIVYRGRIDWKHRSIAGVDFDNTRHATGYGKNIKGVKVYFMADSRKRETGHYSFPAGRLLSPPQPAGEPIRMSSHLIQAAVSQFARRPQRSSTDFTDSPD